MILVLLLGGLAFAALFPLVLPLLRRARPAVERAHYDRIVYHDQLRELKRDVARGVLTEAESISARLEIQRRILATDTVPAAAASGLGRRSPVLASAVALFAAGGAAIVYTLVGAPGIPDTPFSAHQAVAGEAAPGAAGDPAVPGGHNDLSQALGKLAAKLRADPSNADGWQLYARTAGSMSHWEEAVDGYRHLMALGHAGPEVQSGFGETLTLQAGGIVTPAAHDAFVAALKDDPKNDVARYYMGIAAGQAGQPEQAIDQFQTLLGEIPEDSPMREQVAKRITEAANAAGIAVPALAKGTPAEVVDPDEAAMAGMSSMPEGEQKTMIAGMVAKLAASLDADPKNVDGWLRLGRAYVVMGERDKGADAYGRAVALKPGDLGIRLQALEGLLFGLKPEDAFPPGALAMLRQAEGLAPEEPEVLWYDGVIAARDAHPDDAKRYWTKLLTKLPPQGEDAKMVKSAMDSLKGG